MTLSVVTGANRGIGLALTKLLKERGDTVVAACRKTSDDLDALGVEVVEGVDVADAAGAAALKRAIGDRPVDVLINNAGVAAWGEQIGSINYDDMRRLFDVNALGPLRITEAVRDNLRDGSKVGLITSRMGSIDDNTSGGAYAYRASKAALNMIGKSLAEDLKGAGIHVAVLHPGMVKTKMTMGHGQVEPEDAAAGLIARMDQLEAKNTGTFWHQNGERLPW